MLGRVLKFLDWLTSLDWADYQHNALIRDQARLGKEVEERYQRIHGATKGAR